MASLLTPAQTMAETIAETMITNGQMDSKCVGGIWGILDNKSHVTGLCRAMFKKVVCGAILALSNLCTTNAATTL